MNENSQYKNQETFTNTCSWCSKIVSENQEVFGLGATAKRGIYLENQEGKFVPLSLALSEKTVPAFVTISGSQAKREGKDFLFMACSHACAVSLKEALTKEKNILGNISLN